MPNTEGLMLTPSQKEETRKGACLFLLKTMPFPHCQDDVLVESNNVAISTHPTNSIPLSVTRTSQKRELKKNFSEYSTSTTG